MRTIEAVEVEANCDRMLRYVERHRKSILVTKDGVPYCMMAPVQQDSELDVRGALSPQPKQALRRV